MTTTQVVIIAAAVLIAAIIISGRQLTLSYRDIKATIGEKNGNGDIATMSARALGGLAELDRKVDLVSVRLEERTHVTRLGRTEPEELAVYTQDRMHDVLNMLNVLALQMQTLWVFLKDDYSLPDLPSLTLPKPED